MDPKRRSTMVTFLVGLAVCAGLILTVSNAAHAVTVFVAMCTGAQEVPPRDTTATCSATFTLNDAQDALAYSISIMGLDLGGQTPDPADDVMGLHIHRAPAGVNGPIVFGMINPNNDINPPDRVVDPGAGTVTGVWNLLEGNPPATLATELPNLFAEGLYLNVHTMRFPGGETRGQIRQVPEASTITLLLLGLLGLTGAARRPAFHR